MGWLQGFHFSEQKIPFNRGKGNLYYNFADLFVL